MSLTNHPALIEHVVESNSNWNEKRTHYIDASVAFEAMLAEYGLDGALAAIKNQGMGGDTYDSAIRPFYEEAVRRRDIRTGTS